MSLVHPGSGLGRSSEACHLTCYHCSFTGEEGGCRLRCQLASVEWGSQGQEEGKQDLDLPGQPLVNPVGSMPVQIWAFLDFSVTLRPSRP